MSNMYIAISLYREVQETFSFAELRSLGLMGTALGQDLLIWLVQKCACSLNRWISYMFSIIISTVPLHLAWRCISDMLFNYQPNGRA